MPSKRPVKQSAMLEARCPPVELLQPFPAEQMQAARAHKDVGNVKNNRPELMLAEEPAELNSR